MAIPTFLLDLNELIGKESAKKMIQAFGGMALYVPTEKRLKQDHKLAVSIGMDASLKLARFYGGEEINVPKSAKHWRRLKSKKKMIIKMRSTGNSYREIAKKVNCSERALYGFMKRMEDQRKECKQIDLFI